MATYEAAYELKIVEPLKKSLSAKPWTVRVCGFPSVELYLLMCRLGVLCSCNSDHSITCVIPGIDDRSKVKTLLEHAIKAVNSCFISDCRVETAGKTIPAAISTNKSKAIMAKEPAPRTLTVEATTCSSIDLAVVSVEDAIAPVSTAEFMQSAITATLLHHGFTPCGAGFISGEHSKDVLAHISLPYRLYCEVQLADKGSDTLQQSLKLRVIKAKPFDATSELHYALPLFHAVAREADQYAELHQPNLLLKPSKVAIRAAINCTQNGENWDYSMVVNEAIAHVVPKNADIDKLIVTDALSQRVTAVSRALIHRRAWLAGSLQNPKIAGKLHRFSVFAPGWRTLSVTGMVYEFETHEQKMPSIPIPAEWLLSDVSPARFALKSHVGDAVKLWESWMAECAVCNDIADIQSRVTLDEMLSSLPKQQCFEGISHIVQPMDTSNSTALAPCTDNEPVISVAAPAPPVSTSKEPAFTFCKATSLLGTVTVQTLPPVCDTPSKPSISSDGKSSKSDVSAVISEALSLAQGEHVRYSTRMVHHEKLRFRAEDVITSIPVQTEPLFSPKLPDDDKKLKIALMHAAEARGQANIVNYDKSLYDPRGKDLSDVVKLDWEPPQTAAKPVDGNAGNTAAETAQAAVSGVKRKEKPDTTKSAAEKAAKKPKVSFADDVKADSSKSTAAPAAAAAETDAVVSAVAAAATAKDEAALKKFDIPSLKKYLSSKGQRVGGNKTELIARILAL